MKPFRELDEWAYEIECEIKQQLKEGKKIDGKLKRKHVKICTLRDKLYEKHLKEIKDFNRTHIYVKSCPDFKWCIKRLKPPVPSKQPNIKP